MWSPQFNGRGEDGLKIAVEKFKRIIKNRGGNMCGYGGIPWDQFPWRRDGFDPTRREFLKKPIEQTKKLHQIITNTKRWHCPNNVNGLLTELEM